MTDKCIVPEHHSKDKDGYPRMKYQSRLQRGNRLIWLLCYGDISPNLVVAHRCNNKGCINPNHLYLTTKEHNSTDAARDNLYRYGENHPKTKWNDNNILEMLNLYDDGFTQESIANSFNTSQSTVSNCIKRARKIMDTR